MEFMKWCFLLRQETPTRGGASFYDFVPYRYGAYSFCLSRDMQKLTDAGYVREDGATHWSIVSENAPDSRRIHPELQQDVIAILRHLIQFPLDDLLDHVYDRHPWYTVNSKRKKLAHRSLAAIGVYTAGYEGLNVDAFLNMFLRTGIARIVDVRSNPVARQFGFHKSTLARLSGHLDMSYVHLPELGIPSHMRRDVADDEALEVLLTKYEDEIMPAHEHSVRRVADLMREAPSALICREANPSRCHRSRLANVLAKETGFGVTHIGG